MTALVYTLQRHHDVSGISGEGAVATVVEFDDGHAALHWDSATPSTTVYTDIRHITALHGHSGASTLELLDKDRLLRAYDRTMKWLLSARYADRPITVGPHPDHADRLRLTFDGERVFKFWVALFDGSLSTITHEEVAGEIRTTWVSPDGDLWLQYSTPGTFTDLLEGERYDAPEQYTPTATSSDPEEDR